MEQIVLNIQNLEGEVFYTKRRIAFKYVIIGNAIQIVGNRPYLITFQNIQNAFILGPVVGPGAYPNNIIGPSYVWALLNDPRIIQE